MNTPTKRWIKPMDKSTLLGALSCLLMEADDAADFLDAIHAAMQQSSYEQRRFGSVFLGDVADTMREECEAFAEQEIENHEAEMKGYES